MADSISTQQVETDLKNLSVDPKAENLDQNGNILELFANLKEEECIRGKTPADIEKRCLDLCKTYISGPWSKVSSTSDIEVTRITGGLTNQLYRVKVKNSNKADSDVAIKLYMPKHMKSFHEDDDERLNDIVVLTILSEVGIGPKVYGIFADGMIQAFVENEQFTLKYQKQTDKLREVGHLLGRVHNLNVPIRKNHDWVFTQTQKHFTDAYALHKAAELIEEHGLETLKNRDPMAEFRILTEIVSKLKAPFVFCHNDFRGSNILVTKPSGKILFVDLEYSAYGHRGYDIANYLNEWGCEPFDFDAHTVPEDYVIENFVRFYIEGCELAVPGYSKNPDNFVAKIVAEVKVAALVMHMFFLAFLMQSTDNLVEAIPFDRVSNIKYCEVAYQKYFELKERFTKDGTLA